VAEEHEKYDTMEQPWWANDGLILVLTMLNIGIIIYDLETGLEFGTTEWWVLATIDALLIALFTADLIEDHSRCNDKEWWWRTHGWEFLGLMPLALTAIPILQVGGMLRLLRLIRAFSGILRLIGATQRAKEVTIQKQVQHLFLIVFILIVSAAFFVYIFESEYHNENCASDDPPSECNNIITSFQDSIWWAVVTTTTVGYGDMTPMTWPARIIAMCLMMIGIGLVGSLAATLSQLFYSTRDTGDEFELEFEANVLDQLERFSTWREKDVINEETWDLVKDLLVRRIRAEIHMLKVEMHNSALLPVPMQVAAKMAMKDRIKNMEAQLIVVEEQLSKEEEADRAAALAAEEE
jgi:voltage-gated potassium channel